MILLLCAAIGAIYFLVIKKPAEPIVEEEPVEEPVIEIVEVEPTPAPKPKPEPKPEPKVEKKPVVVVKEKTAVDLLLEEKFPFPDSPSLDEYVQGWDKVPKELFPDLVIVNVSRMYADTSSDAKKFLESGHRATPVLLLNGKLTVHSEENAKLSCRLSADDTDFKQQVKVNYEKELAAQKVRVLATREAYRSKAEEYLVSLANAEKAPKPQPKVAVEVDEVAESFDAKKYGRKFRGDGFLETANGKNNEHEHEVPMGPIGSVAAVLYGKKEARLVSVWEDGPGARAGLKVGDLVVKINGKRFAEYGKSNYDGGKGFPEDLGLAMLRSQDEGSALELTVLREKEELPITIDLPALPDFGKKFPTNCGRAVAVSEAAADYLLSNVGGEGLLRANDYTNAWFGLALLSTGDPQYSRQIKKMARFYGKKYDLGNKPSNKDLINGTSENGSASNWFVTTVGMFLAEYYLATGDNAVLDALDHCCRSMDIRVHPKNGRFGHGRDMHSLPYDGKGLVIINVHAHIMWALTAQIRGFDNWDWKTWDLSYKAIEVSLSEDGSVGYNFSARGGSQCTPRTGAMLTALKIANKEKSTARQMGKWLYKNNQVFPDVHAMSFIGPMFGFTGLKNTNDSHYRKVMDEYRWLYSLKQPANFKYGMHYFGDRENTGGDEYCNKRYVANIQSIYLMNSHRENTLWMSGNRKKNWYKK